VGGTVGGTVGGAVGPGPSTVTTTAMTSSLSSSSGAPTGSSHWCGDPVLTAHQMSVPVAAGVYVIVHWPAALVVQVKSGLFPFPPGSLGPLMK
jgi:hypothetical protein